MYNKPSYINRMMAESRGIKWTKRFYAVADANQYILLYAPTTGQPPWPTCIFVHGGGWQNGGPIITASEAPYGLLAQGIAIASVHHRFPTVAAQAWPKQSYDITSAVRWVKANSGRYNLNPSRLCLWGYSSGAHLAALASFSNGVSVLRDLSTGYSGYSQDVKLCVLWATPTYFPSNDGNLITNTYVARTCFTTSAEAELLGGIGTGVNPCSGGGLALSTECDPNTYIVPTTTKYRIEHGQLDQTIAYQSGQALHNALVNAGINSTYIQHATLDHTTIYNNATAKSNAISWIASNI